MYGHGCKRQAFTVFSRLGLTESYSGTVKKGSKEVQQDTTDVESESNDTTRKKRKFNRGGSLWQLSSLSRSIAQQVASTGLFGTVYDNINWLKRHAEYVLGRSKGWFHYNNLTLIILIRSFYRYNREWDMRYYMAPA
jgi:hypothetical protein